MPGLQGEHVVAALGSPVKKSRLSLKFFQKKETKRALDFSEPPSEEPKTAVEDLEEPAASCDQVVPGPALCPASPSPLLPCEKSETLVPFVGFNNLGNTCYLNSILQVLYYCPGLRDGIKKLYSLSKRQDKPKEEQTVKSEEEEQTEDLEESLPAHMQLLGSFNGLIASVEQLQSSFLLSPEEHSDGELATPPRKLLQTLRRLNPMYEGYLQHDAQEVLQCILGYIQEACDTIKKEQNVDDDVIEVKPDSAALVDSNGTAAGANSPSEEEGQTSGKRKSDTEVGNAKKKPKSVKSKKSSSEEDGGKKPLTRSKRKSSSDITLDGAKDDGKEEEDEEEGEKKRCGEEEEGEGEIEGKGGKVSKEAGEGKRKKRAKLSWLKPSGKQPSIFSKFRSMGRISSITGAKSQTKPDQEKGANNDGQTQDGKTTLESSAAEDKTSAQSQGCEGLDLMERLFQGRLVLRTRCLECESYTERREDFQDISVPVQEDQPCSPENLSEVSPDPKPELKTLKWAISQFASVERIVGEDKYFCETCHHYTEAERSLLFDKTPEVITIHLKCFSANGLELDPYAGLSKVNTPLQTPLTLSLDEWCTRPSPTGGRHYQLFAVVMHSGVTISSGHYTTYIRMSDLRDTRLWPQDKKERAEEDDKEGSRETEEKEEVLDYDDGEVSFRLRGKRHGRVTASSGAGVSNSKTGAKKTSEGVGLLGGQRSVSSYDIGGSSSGTSSTKQPDKTTSSGATTEGSRRRRTISGPGSRVGAGVKKGSGDVSEAGSGMKAEVEEASGPGRGGGGGTASLGSLSEYEGKWLLFDDSEVHSFQEEDFLRACSPETCSTSTPYLLFYRRIPSPQH